MAAPYLIIIQGGKPMFFSDEINKKSDIDVRDISMFLKKHGVKYDYPETTFVIRDNREIISTGSLDGNVFKYFFTDEEYKGQGTISVIYNSLVKNIMERGRDSFFVFTGPRNEEIFKSLGLSLVYKTSNVVLLEGGFYNYESWIKKTKNKLKPKNKEVRGSIVMNCNPMTLGHKYLIEKALEKVDYLIIFLVEEDKSVFPFKERWGIMSKELSEYKNIEVVPSGPYIISSGTFPTYFLKKEDDKLDLYTRLDGGIFKDKIAKDLDIDIRFLGSEPYDTVTRAYNESLKNIFEESEINLEIISRKELDGNIISASMVRKLLKDGKEEETYKFLPESSISFLKSKIGQEIVEKLRKDT